jgi:hypothetical protein
MLSRANAPCVRPCAPKGAPGPRQTRQTRGLRSRQTCGLRWPSCNGAAADPVSLVLSFAGLVAVARSLNPIPSRTRPLNSSAPMVLCLKTWESRSSPGLPRTIPPKGQPGPSNQADHSDPTHPPTTGALRPSPLASRPPHNPGPRQRRAPDPIKRGTPPGTAKYKNRQIQQQTHDAGWSSPVARQAHNLKAAGSNPAPATNDTCSPPAPRPEGCFAFEASARMPARSP